MMAATELLKLTDITKRYGSITALDNVSLNVTRGEVVGLVGDNGAGKSTLVKSISGLIRPDEGTIELDGVTHAWSSPADSLDAGIETVYQDMGLAAQLSVSANIFLGREIKLPGFLGKLGFLNEREMQRRSAQDVKKIGIRIPDTRASVSDLSGGQRQAVAIGRAVSWTRKLLLLDEPTNHLGVAEVEEVLRLIREVKNQGVSVILISHTLPHVLAVTDRIVVLRLGRVVAERETNETSTDDLVRDITGASEQELYAHARS